MPEFVRCSTVVMLLSRNVLLHAPALIEAYEALVQGKQLITVYLSRSGYDYDAANALLRNLESELEKQAPRELARLKQTFVQLGHGSVSALQGLLSEALPNIITITWQPHAGTNHTASVIDDILSRLRIADVAQSFKGKAQGNATRLTLLDTSSLNEKGLLAVRARALTNLGESSWGTVSRAVKRARIASRRFSQSGRQEFRNYLQRAQELSRGSSTSDVSVGERMGSTSRSKPSEPGAGPVVQSGTVKSPCTDSELEVPRQGSST
jgi:hypothetical protein